MATATRTRKRGNGEKQDSYQLVTDRIIEALEQGVVPWHRPWRSDLTAPMSLSSRKPYNGINVFVLTATAQVCGYESRWWGTYKQIGERGGQVRKGERGTPVVFWRFVERKDPATGEVDRIPFLRHFTVFNADQADDLDLPAEEPLPERDPIASCETIVAGYSTRGGPQLRHGGDRAYYSPPFDRVQLPKLGQFESAEHYYGTLFHEFGHSTGHESRLDRATVTDAAQFGSESYSREELVAEMAAAFVCGEGGIDVNVPHRAGYIASWLRVLRDDKKAVVAAGGAAQRAADLILGREREAREETA